MLTSLYQLVFILKILFSCLYKTSYLNEEVNCTEPSPSDIIALLEPTRTKPLVGLWPKALSSYVKLGWNWLSATNDVAYYDSLLNTTAKRLEVHDPLLSYI